MISDESPSVDPRRIEELLTYCTDFAKQMLTAYGEFHPFGAVIKSDEEFTAVGGSTGKEFPKGAEVFTLLRDSFRAQFESKEIIAAAIAANVDIPAQFASPFPDGVRVLLECAGYSRFIYLPYRINKPSIASRLFRRPLRIEYHEFISVDIQPMLHTHDA